MNHCYYCDKSIDHKPYNGKRSYCKVCKKKWAVTIREEEGKEQQKQQIAQYWLK
jgi:hypothetical protein